MCAQFYKNRRQIQKNNLMKAISGLLRKRQTIEQDNFIFCPMIQIMAPGQCVDEEKIPALFLPQAAIYTPWLVVAYRRFAGLRYHMQGVGGLKPDTTVAYAFWQKAADMCAPGAQTLLGAQLLASYDSPKDGFWANKKIGLQMLECALSQGQGAAARKLGLEYERQKTSEGKHRALAYYQEGVKFGDQDSADALEIAFESGPLDYAAPFVDHDRERRYQVFGKELRDNPDLRFPNLDKILPLPAAKLPQWSGKPEDRINAAKEIHPVPSKLAPNAAS
jgi:hypothetical protein